MYRCRSILAVLVLLLAAAAPALAADPPAADPPAAAPAAADLADLGDLDGPLFTPAPRPTAPPCHYCATGFTTSPGGGAASHWGHGADCASAQNDARAQLLSFVISDCQEYGTAGRCSFQVVYTCSCYYQNGQWTVDAYANYGCWVYYC